jgi:hypothetical protein
MNIQHNIKILLCNIILLTAVELRFSEAQSIAIDRGVRIEGLWCFPLVTDSLQYLYLPDRSLLAVDDKKQPQFSFTRYVNTGDTTTTTAIGSTISQAGGGGVLHFLVTYDTDEKKVQRAAAALKELLNNNEVRLRGPIIFKEGRFALVSSIINNEGTKTQKVILSMGAAPVLQGSKIALSFELDPQRSKLLLENFKMATPDVSIVFDLIFSGITDAYNAKLTIDWAEVMKHEKISGGVNVYFVSADLEKIYTEMRQTTAIKLETIGEDDKMQRIVDGAYAKLTELMFKKVEPEQLPPGAGAGLGSLLGDLFSNGGSGAFSSGKTFGFGAHVGYKRKDIKTSGYSVLNFNSRNATDRHHYITFNIGDIYKKYGDNTAYFKTISLEDPDFQKRDIAVGLDGDLLPEFDKLINNITVTLRKTHQNGNTTLKEARINKEVFNSGKNPIMVYGAVGDVDRTAWLNYEYKAQYNFRGGKMFIADWVQQNTAMINLFVPYERRKIKLEADTDLLKSKNVRAITIKIDYDFFGEKRVTELTVKPDDDFTQKYFEITLPSSQFNYHYMIRWRMKDGTEKIMDANNDNDLLFIDAIPTK